MNLTGAMVDSLVALVERGPLGDRDVPSKVGRDELISSGLAVRVIVKGEDGYTAATHEGSDAYKKYFSPMPNGSDCQTRDEAKAMRKRRMSAGVSFIRVCDAWLTPEGTSDHPLYWAEHARFIGEMLTPSVMHFALAKAIRLKEELISIGREPPEDQLMTLLLLKGVLDQDKVNWINGQAKNALLFSDTEQFLLWGPGSDSGCPQELRRRAGWIDDLEKRNDAALHEYCENREERNDPW